MIYGSYSNNSGVRESETLMLILQEDSSYSLTYYSECPFKMDSGVFHIFNDTILLEPLVKFDGVLASIDSNIKNVQNKLLVNKGKLNFIDFDKALSDSFALKIQGQKSEIRNLLDKNGNGYLRIIDTNYNTLEEGYYKDYKIYNGLKYNYENSLSNSDLIPRGVEVRVYVTLTVIEVKDGVEQ